MSWGGRGRQGGARGASVETNLRPQSLFSLAHSRRLISVSWACAAHVGPRFDIDLLVSLLRQENARDICVIWVSPALKYVDYFVVASGASPRHLQAMAQYLLKTHKFLRSPREAFARIEGKDSEDWLCVDFGCMVVHLMLPGTRETYELEKLWTLGTWDDQLAQIAPEVLPEDFILGFSPEGEPSAFPPLEFKRK
ncbi:mitochondrial assembly of ribosomal large subunit protein 1 isoform X2 [Monodelphis domestica]|uniref:mitochondrial assembly of ribosomal large subunit protein 1 isoform X2 n=1 Tax=Monodelphis domestica TaxID=13616 RepID=UPI0024E1F0A9|nr:mitochondrial assembly of ribosomal large subunit protein 1 isoform X2 [Monodelphis domestica]